MRRALAFLVITASACAAHVNVPERPAETATLDERVAYYDTVKAAGVANERQRTTLVNRYGDVVGTKHTEKDRLVLANGLRVFYGGDLVPALEPTTRAGKVAVECRSIEDWSDYALYGAMGFAVGGFGLFVAAAANDDPNLPDTSFQAAAAWAGTGLLGGAVVSAVASAVIGGYARTLREEIFAAYNDSLRAGLGLGGDL